MEDLEKKSEAELRDDFLREIMDCSMDYYANYFPKEIQRLIGDVVIYETETNN